MLKYTHPRTNLCHRTTPTCTYPPSHTSAHTHTHTHTHTPHTKGAVCTSFIRWCCCRQPCCWRLNWARGSMKRINDAMRIGSSSKEQAFHVWAQKIIIMYILPGIMRGMQSCATCCSREREREREERERERERALFGLDLLFVTRSRVRKGRGTGRGRKQHWRFDRKSICSSRILKCFSQPDVELIKNILQRITEISI
jgi:hypothetical protein